MSRIVLIIFFTLFSSLFANNNQNHFIFKNSVKSYLNPYIEQGVVSAFNIYGSDIFYGFIGHIGLEYDHYLDNDLNSIFAISFENITGAPHPVLLAEIGIKKTFHDNNYFGSTYTYPIDFSNSGSRRSSTSSWIVTTFSVAGYKPNFSLFTGVYIDDDWVLELKVRKVVYHAVYMVKNELTDERTYIRKDIGADELSLALGLVF